jgi:hypothetical protein
MTFDTRARRAAQGIHRAVEAMEMSSTKTPQRLTRFDQYRERKSRNKRIAALAVGIAVPLVLLIVAVLVLGPDRDQNVPITTPTASVTPTSVSGSTHQFKAPFTYTVPQSWALSGEGARYFSLDSTVVPGGHLIVLSNVRAGRLDCSTRPDLSVGTSSDAMTTWLSTHPALDATKPRPVTLGAATGSYVDVQLAARQGKAMNCPEGLQLVTRDPDGPQGWGIGPFDKDRLYVLDLPSGDTVTIVVDAPSGASDSPSAGSDFQDLMDQTVPVVESFNFHK